MRPLVLYEDQAGHIKEFGPHKLVCACIADLVGGDVFKIQRAIEGHPKKGDTKLLRDYERHAADGGRILAIFDGDKLHRRLGMPKSADRKQLARALRERGSSPQVTAYVLPGNLETVFDATLECLSWSEPLPAGKPDLLLRDRVFKRAAFADRRVRDCILDKIPVLREGARALAGLLPPR